MTPAIANSLSIVVPSFNEEENLGPTVAHIIEASPRLKGPFEIVIVNDSSTDKTGAVADDLARRYPFVRVIHNPQNLGFGGSYKRGVDNSTLSYVLMVPGDDAYPVASLEKIFEKVGTANIVMSYTTNMQIRSLGRRWVSNAFVIVMNLLFNLRLKYYNGVTVLPTKTAQTIEFSKGFSYAAENLVRLIKLRGFTYEQVPCEITERKVGRSSALKFKNILSVMAGVAALMLEVYSAAFMKKSSEGENQYGEHQV